MSKILQDAFYISPRIFHSHQPVVLDLRGRAIHLRTEVLQAKGAFSMLWLRVDGTRTDGELQRWNRYEGPVEPQVLGDGTLRFILPAQDEGELYCRFQVVRANGSREDICCFSIYVLDEDLYGLEPLRGDFHVHSSFSACGERCGDPCWVAAVAMQQGLDFMALTDHEQREGSEYLMEHLGEFYEGDFKVYPGEECHLLEKHLEQRVCGPNDFLATIHIVSFGASEGIFRYANDHYDAYRSEIAQRMTALDSSISESLRFAMAGSDWIFDKIHEYGGLAIFVHPFWMACHRMNLPKPVREYIMAQGKFDAMELPGLGANIPGEACRQSREGNVLASAWWTEECIKAGRMIPVVGNTDSHDAKLLLGRQYTIVWAKENSREAISEAVRNGLTATVAFYEGDYAPQIYGSLRLVTLARFLIQEIFPLAQEERQLQGLQMLQRLRQR